MNQRVVSVVFVLTMVALCVAGRGDGNAPDSGGDPGSGGKPVVFTTFYPTTYFAQRIAGEFAEVVCPLPEGADPIFGHPEADQVLTYQAADLVIVNGASFEKWVGN